MWCWRGNIYGTVDSQPQELPMEIQSFSLSNRTGVTLNATVYMINTAQGIETAITPRPVQLATAEMYEDDKKIGMNQNDFIRIVTNGNCDYYFTIENSKAPD